MKKRYYHCKSSVKSELAYIINEGLKHIYSSP